MIAKPRMVVVLGAMASLTQAASFARTTPPTGELDAAALYVAAAKAITVDSPGCSSLEYPKYPPFNAAWRRMAGEAWKKNMATWRLVREARNTDRADWPKKLNDYGYFSGIADVVIQLQDAALYQHLNGNDAEAIRFAEDILHLTALVRHHLKPGEQLRPFVAGLYDARACSALMMIASGVKLTNDADDVRDLQVNVAQNLISELLHGPDVGKEVMQVAATGPVKSLNNFRKILTAYSSNRIFAATSLACHLFRFDKHRWPKSLPELVPNYLPNVPIDPWGNGKQTFGYVVIKGGLPGGGDRPLLFDEDQSSDGLFYRTDQPEYDFYVLNYQTNETTQKHGGQFRDVASWVPARPPSLNGPATRSLP